MKQYNIAGVKGMTLEEKIAQYIIIGERKVLHPIPLPKEPCWFWKPIGQAPYRYSRPRPGQANGPKLERNGKTNTPFRHFFPDVPTRFRLASTTCNHSRGAICVNPHHRILPSNCAPQEYNPTDGLWHSAVDRRKEFFLERKRQLDAGELLDWNDETNLTDEQKEWMRPADED